MFRAGFNLLFHGYGCKKHAIDAFAQEALDDGGGLVVVNAHRAATTGKQVALAVVAALTDTDASLFRCDSAAI